MRKNPCHYLFLYSRLPGYFYRCVQYLLQNSPEGSKAWIVCYMPDPNAPYRFDEPDGSIQITDRESLKGRDVESWQPDLIYMAGWGDKKYNHIAQTWNRRVPVIIGMDNPWKGTFKQRLATIFASFYLKKRASYLWIPGYPQYELARKIGFRTNHILFDLYCADVDKWKRPGPVSRKRILFAGRMVPYKRPDWLAEAFIKLIQLHPELSDWELLMIGNGPLWDSLESKYGSLKQVMLKSFVQPVELIGYYHESSIFCLPSFSEHWGVAVQEAAAAGLPLLLSDTCGAASAFLINGYNGFVFKSTDKDNFYQRLYGMMSLEMEELQVMGSRSESLARRITHDQWSGTLKSVLDGQ